MAQGNIYVVLRYFVYYYWKRGNKMKRVKKIIYFLIGLAIVPVIVAYSTAFVLKIDIFERLYTSLFIDYMLAYILTPLLSRANIQKYLNKYAFFALIFFLFWLFEIFRITFIWWGYSSLNSNILILIANF